MSASDLRIGGLASGIDTQAMIDKLLTGEKRKVDMQYQQRQLLEWKRDDFRTVNTKLSAVKNSLLDLKLDSTFNGKTVKSSDETIMTATARSDALPGVYNVKVKQLASRVTMSSQEALGSTDDKSTIAKQFGLADDTEINFTLKGSNGEIPFSFKASSCSLNDLARIINDENMGIRASYDAGVDRFFLTTDGYGSDGEITIKCDGIVGSSQSFLKDFLKLNVDYTTLNAGGPPADRREITSTTPLNILNPAPEEGALYTPPSGTTLLSALYFEGNAPETVSFTLEGTTGTRQTFTFDTAAISINDMVSAINAGATGVTASYNETTGQFSLSSGGMLAIRKDDGFLGDVMKLEMFSQEGNKAIIDFDDAGNLEFDSNQFWLNNIHFNLLEADPTRTLSVKVENNIDGAVEKIKAFVEVYNTAIVHMNTELTERRYNNGRYGGDYPPLSAAQKKEMSEDEIKAWEEKAKSGMLRGDSTLFAAYSSIRRVTTDPVQGLSKDNPFASLASIGITTGTFVRNSLEGAKLNIDEDKLRAALETDADKVMELFTLNTPIIGNDGKPVKDWNGDPTYNKGIAQRLYDTLDLNIAAITTKAGISGANVDTSLLTKEISRVNQRITLMEERIESLTERYWKQFSAMEQAVAAMTAQGEWLMQRMMDMQGNQG